MTSNTLTPGQAHALLDILSHHELYQEILDFRYPGVLAHYGPPFQEQIQTSSTFPSLQSLVSKFILNLPGLKDVSDEFWQMRVYSILERFQKAGLSESYDKGLVGIRKTLATASSALIEYPTRGVFAGFDEPSADEISRDYDNTRAQDLQVAFRDMLHQAVYGHVIDDVVKKIGETDKLSDHTPMIQSAHEFGLVNIASFLHYALIISPKGQNLLMLIDHTNKMVPYTLIKQTLRIGNVATMISAMVRVVLAKMSVTSVTNWIGLTANQDEGMNLMQHIISQVLQWDIRDLKHKAAKVEKEKQSLTKDQLHALKEYPSKPMEVHEDIRSKSSSDSKSIVSVILAESSVSTALSNEQHKLAQEYLALQLSIRDREQIIQVLCHAQPDHLTNAVRDLVAAYEPLIRQLHEAVDLSETVTHFEVWLKDLIKLSKLADPKAAHGKHSAPPTVGDFVHLLKKHQSSLHRFLHQVVKNGKDITSWFHEYALQATSHFRRTSSHSLPSGPNAGDLTEKLSELFRTVPEQNQSKLSSILYKHEKYISKVHAASAARLQSVIVSPPSRHPALQPDHRSAPSSQPSSRSGSPAPTNRVTCEGLASNPGPGAFLAKWQDLIDTSEITPAVAEGGEVRTGTQGSVLKASRVGIASKLLPPSGNTPMGVKDEVTAAHSESSTEVELGASVHETEEDEDEDDIFEEAYEKLDQFALDEDEKVKPPDVRPVVEALGSAFRDMLARKMATPA